MARPRGFDEDEALQQAMLVFWRLGYVATSMSDLYAATGLKPGSLYAAFRDKETLFQRVFERYAAQFRATLPVGAEGLQAIRAWLDVQAGLATGDASRSGCLIVNTVAERSAHSETTRAMADARLAEIRAFFARHLAVAGCAGALADGVDAEAAADGLLGAVVAIMTLGRAGADAGVIGHVADQAMRGLAR